MAVLHKHRYSSFWSPQRVPTVQVEIDWSHPLARGLVGLYVPGGAKGLVDLCGIGPRLAPMSGLAGVADSGVGPGLNCVGASTGAQGVTRFTGYEFTTQNVAVFHVGWHFGVNGSFSALLIGCATGGAPAYGLDLADSNTSARLVLASWATTVVIGNIGIGRQTVGATFTCAGSAPYVGYLNGKALVSGTTAVTASTYDSGSREVIGTLGGASRNLNMIALGEFIYNTGTAPMTADLIAWLHNEPFAMLRPVAKRTYGIIAAAPPVGGSSRLPLIGVGAIAPELVVGAAAARLVRENPIVTRRRIITLGEGDD